MKKQRLLQVLAAALLIVLAFAYAIKSKTNFKNEPIPRGLDSSSSKKNAIGLILVGTDTNFLTKPAALKKDNDNKIFTVVTDPKLGKWASVGTDKVMALRNKDGTVIWSTNIEKFVGTTQIYDVKLFGSNIEVYPAGWEKKTIFVNKDTSQVTYVVY